MGGQVAKVDDTDEAAEEEEDPTAGWSLEQRTAEALAAELISVWGPPIQTLSRAGRAFGGLEALLGGGRAGTFDLQVNLLPIPVHVCSNARKLFHHTKSALFCLHRIWFQRFIHCF